MEAASLQFLQDLLATPSPSGFEQQIQEIVRQWARQYADDVSTDLHGNVIAVRNPGAEPRIMLAGHCDQLGLMVEYIDDQGYLYVQPIGGWDMQILLGQHLTVWTATGAVHGVCSRKAPHLLTSEERKKVPEFHEVWVDIGAKDKEQAESLVRVGDVATVSLSYWPMLNDMASSPGMDDKVGLWTVMETLRLLHGRELNCSVYCVSTVQEEVGLRGATTSSYGIHPTIGIAVDVTHASDTPGSSKKQIGEAKLGSGPVLVRGPNINPRVFDWLDSTSKAFEVPVQLRASPRATGTDANAIQLARAGVAVGLVGIPNRYMHSPVEMVSLRDMENAARLLAEACASVTPEMSWIP
jgi:tetrahedral aminopeptidase